VWNERRRGERKGRGSGAIKDQKQKSVDHIRQAFIRRTFQATCVSTHKGEEEEERKENSCFASEVLAEVVGGAWEPENDGERCLIGIGLKGGGGGGGGKGGGGSS